MSVQRDNGEFSQEHRWIIQKAKRLAFFCHEHDFIGWQCMQGLKVSKLASLYNGIGPDWNWGVISKIIGSIDKIFEPAAFIQDIQYRISSDRSEDNFHKINAEFYENCLKCIKLSINWWHWLKRRKLAKSARVLFEESEKHGMNSWKKYSGEGK